MQLVRWGFFLGPGQCRQQQLRMAMMATTTNSSIKVNPLARRPGIEVHFFRLLKGAFPAIQT